jgi:hypothetical protein
MFSNISKLIVYIGLIGFSLLFFSCGQNRSSKNRSEVSNGVISFSYCNSDLLVISMKDGKSFIIDTGSDISLIFSDRMRINSTIRGFTVVNRKYLSLVKRIDSLQIGNILIKNHDFVFEKAVNTFFKSDTTIVGLIGMDILSQKFSYFDMKNQTVTFSNKKITQTEDPFFIFDYKSRNRPTSDVNINGNIFKDVLFDTGFDSFLELLEDDRKILNLHDTLKNITGYDIFNNKYLHYFEEPDSIKISNNVIQNPIIIYSKEFRLLGIKFAKQWSSFSIDPFKKEIEFYL